MVNTGEITTLSPQCLVCVYIWSDCLRVRKLLVYLTSALPSLHHSLCLSLSSLNLSPVSYTHLDVYKRQACWEMDDTVPWTTRRHHSSCWKLSFLEHDIVLRRACKFYVYAARTQDDSLISGLPGAPCRSSWQLWETASTNTVQSLSLIHI